MTSLVAVYILFIFLIILLRTITRRARGVSMSNLEKNLAVVATISATIWAILAILADYVIPNLPIISGMPPIVVWLIFVVLVIITAIVAIRYYSIRQPIPDIRFTQLTVHFSSRKDTPENSSERPRFVVFEKTKQAYWVSDLIQPYILAHKIDWYTHDNEQTLYAHFKEQGITVNKRKALADELGLWLTPYGTLRIAYNPLNEELLRKFSEHKLKGKFKNFQIAFIFPWYTWFSRNLETRVFPPDKILLINFQTKIAHPPPSSVLQLYRNGVLACDDYHRFPLELLRCWCWRHGWKFDRRPLTESELLGENQ